MAHLTPLGGSRRKQATDPFKFFMQYTMMTMNFLKAFQTPVMPSDEWMKGSIYYEMNGVRFFSPQLQREYQAPKPDMRKKEEGALKKQARQIAVTRKQAVAKWTLYGYTSRAEYNQARYEQKRLVRDICREMKALEEYQRQLERRLKEKQRAINRAVRLLKAFQSLPKPQPRWEDLPIPREEMKPGVKRATSVKQVKVRAIIREPDVVWFRAADYQPQPEKKITQEVANYKQLRFSKFLQSFKQRTVTVALSSGTTSEQKYGRSELQHQSITALLDGLSRGYARLMMEKNPSLRSNLEYYYELETRKKQQAGDKADQNIPNDLHLPYYQAAEPNMEEPHGNTDVESSKAGNVVLQNPLSMSESRGAIKKTTGFLPYASAVESQVFSQLTDRWLKYSNELKWSTSDVLGTELIRLKLPYDILLDNLNSPNVTLFKIHKYARTSMKVRIIVNSNKFQVGQLQCSWMYGSHYNANYSSYDNVYLASQRKHVLINAGASNWGEIDIPYWHLLSLMSSKTNSREIDEGYMALSLGELSIKVLAPLTVPDGATVLSAAYLSVEVMFYDCEFRGLCDASLHSPLRPQMEDIVNTTERVLNLVAPVFNMDNPIKPAVATLMQPTTAHSFSVCKRQNEIMAPLRADPLGQTPGLFSGDGQATQIKKLLTHWSLVKQFEWKNTDEMGSKLITIDSTPIMSKSTYSKRTVSSVDYYSLPIISILSNFFAYWRGDIELRFDFVASQFHTGSVMISTIPGGEGTESIDVAKNSASQVFSLSDQQQCVYRIPYYGNVPFWKVKHNLDRTADVIPPSRTIMYVFNKLIPMQNITNKVQVNMYIRGADNFELALLKSPSLGSSLNTVVYIPPSSTAWVDPEWPQIFTSSSRWSYNRLCMFDSQTTDYFTQFINLKFNTVYKVPDSTAKVKVAGDDIYVRVQYYRTASDLSEVGYMVRLVQYPSYPVVACFDTLANAQKYAKDPSVQNLEACGLQYYAQGPWAQQSRDGRNWYSISRSLLPKVPFVEHKTEFNGFEIIPQVDDAVDAVTSSVRLDAPAATTTCGERTFGEKIENLTELCKRWQHYGCGVLNFGSQDRNPCLSQTNAGLTIGVFPRKIFNVWGSGDRDNRLRDGAISLVSSAFAGYRGGIRFRIIVSGQGAKNLTVGVTHKFDKRINLSKPCVQVGIVDNLSAADWLDSAYATTVQSTFVNNCLEFEVPFYNRGEYNSNYVPAGSAIQILDNYSTLGQVKVYFSGFEKDKRVGIDVYYSIADDFAFSNFQGFPDMMFLDSIPDEPPALAEPNMDYIKSFFTTPKKIGDICDSVVSATGSVGSKIVETLTSLTSTVGKAVTIVGSKAKNGLATLLSACGGFAHSVLCQILHVLSKPKCKFTLAIAIFSILCAYFSDKISDMLGIVTSAISKFWNWLTGSKQHLNGDEKVQPQAEEEDENCATFLSLLWSLVATAASYIGEAPKNLMQFAKSMFKKSSDTFRTHVFGIKFFRDFMKVLKRMWGWINQKLGFSKPLYNLSKDDAFLKDWFLMSSIVLAPENENNIVTHPDWIGRLFECQIVGRLINQAAINTAKDITPSLLNAIKSNQQHLTRAVDGLIQRRCYVPIRQEPFIVWMVGRAGVGKTHISQQIMRDLAMHFELKPDIFSLVANQQYYDMLVDQKFVLLDDFLNWTGQGSENAFAQYLQMSGSNMLSLPRAVCDKKAVLDNFEFLFVTSNDMFFDNIVGITHPEAYNRRRHLTIAFQLSAAFKKRFVNETAALEAFRKLPDASKSAHIEFHLHELDDKKPKLVLKNYDDLITHVKSYATSQRVEANKKFLTAVKHHCDALENAASSSCSFKEYFDKLKEVNDDITDRDVIPESVDWIVERLKSRYAVYDKKAEDKKEEVKLTDEDTVILDKHKDEILKDLMTNKVTFAEALNKFKPKPEAQGPTYADVVKNLEPQGPTQDAFELLKQAVDNLKKEDEEQLERFEKPYNDFIRHFPIPEIAHISAKNGLRGVFEETDMCPHRRFNYASAIYYKFTDITAQAVVDGKQLPYAPKGCFVDPCGAKHDFKQHDGRSFACFDTPCITAEGGLNLNCCWTTAIGRNTLKYDEHLANYWTSLLGILVLKEQDFNKFMAEKEKLLTIMPKRLYDRLDAIYNSDKTIKLPNNMKPIKSNMAAMDNGFLADRISVAGVHHGVYPTNAEVKTGERKDTVVVERSKGILYDSATFRRNGVETKCYKASTTMTVILNIGMIIAGISGILMFINMILTFLEYWGIFSFYGWNTGKDVYNPTPQDDLEPQLSTSGDIKAKSSGSKPLKSPKFVMANSGESDKGILTKITKNVFFIRYVCGDKVKTARCLGICGHYGLVLTHYFENFEYMCAKNPTAKMMIYRVGMRDWIPFDMTNVKRFATDTETGLQLVLLPKNFTVFKDIRPYMPSASNVVYKPVAKLVETFYDDEQATIHQKIHHLKITLTRGTQYVSAKPDTGIADWSISDKLEYAYSGAGVCGSFLLAEGPIGLYGVHTAGMSRDHGFSELLFKEMFEHLSSEPQMEDPDLPVYHTKYVPNGPHEVVGVVEKAAEVFISRKTRIVPSLIHGELPVATEPAPLSPYDPRLPRQVDPLMAGVEKRCDLLIPFNHDDIKIAMDDLDHVLDVNCKPVRKVEILTPLQAINGIPGIKGMERIHMQTSEGYPYVLDRPPTAHNKKWLFKFEKDEVVGLHPLLDEVLRHKQQLRKQNRVPKSYFAASLKDARILKSKVNVIGKTRVFEMSPVDLTIAQRQLFLDFYASYMHNNFECENTIGINPNSEQWSRLANKLVAFSPHIIAGDYSSYGPKMSLDVLHIVWKLCSKWMLRRVKGDSTLANQMHTMSYECLNSLLIVGNYVMRAQGGMHSGNCATVILNSLCNSILVRLAYMAIMRQCKPSKASMFCFKKNVLMFSNGDDLLMSVKPDIIEWFNNVSLANFFADHNLKYTSSKKTNDELLPYESIYEVSFLKHCFKHHPFRSGQWLAALDEVSIQDCSQWVWMSENIIDATLENCDQAVRLAYGHGEVYYTNFGNKIKQILAKHGLLFDFAPWREWDARIWDEGELLTPLY